ncbi:antitoxin of toxin-antitoxin stability system [Lactobacillus delbrueckii]|uniref:antitoxin of toxin-antitoxin stability system n=1 Tax=Lactobacillus delbrueckii TaxID=1584 RepID=UPI0022E5C62B|nr:antitoxin of toxin-antitoxin stability system [Lactobacillus delbrueckii]
MAENRAKVRLVGDSKVLPIPKNIVADAEEYSVYQGRDGIIVFVPESLNPFRDPDWDKKFTECKQEEAFRGLT